MIINFGKHYGKSIELLVLKEPSYIKWMLRKNDAKGELRKARNKAIWLIKKFDNKNYIKSCYGNGCQNTVTYCTVYKDNVTSIYWWCDKCDHYQSGASKGNLFPIRTYRDALDHVALYCNNRKRDFNSIIISLARAKGLTKQVGEKQAKIFFQ